MHLHGLFNPVFLERVAVAAPFKHLVRLSLLVLIIAYSAVFFSHNKSV
jgi:hypothetical protein